MLFQKVMSSGLVVAALSILAATASAADCNGNDADDRDDIAAGFSEDCNSNGIPDECEQTLLRFGSSGPVLRLTETPHSVTTADFNGDGLLDLAAGAQEPRSNTARITVFLNESDPEPGEFSRGRRISSQYGISMIAPGDFDGDGDVDLVTVDDSVLAVFANDGEGVLAVALSVEIPGNLIAVTVAHLNEDENLDLAVTNSNLDQVQVLLGEGGGNFADPVGYDVGDSPYGLDSADLDGDGDVDLAVVNWRSDDLSVLWNDGSGNFTASTLVESIGRSPRSLVAVDLDLDGKIDLAVASLNAVMILLNAGERSFREPTSFVLRSRFLDAGDFDGDGDPDLVVGSSSSNLIGILVNEGDGTFRSKMDLGAGATARTVVTGDFDDDGDVDIAVGTDEPDAVSILWNGQERRTISYVGFRYRFGQPPHGAEMGDMDGDGDLDYVAGNGLRSTVSVLINDGSGIFRLKAHTSTAGYLNTIDLEDLDGDGDLDVITAHRQGSQVMILKNEGDGTLTRALFYPAGNGPFMVLGRDFDGDGHIDVASANIGARRVSVLWNVGDGSFEAPTQLLTGSNPRCVAAGDFDGDGKLDVASANEGSRSVSVMTNLGDRVFDRAVNLPTGGSPFYVISGDWNRDGHTDLVTAMEPQSRIGLLWNRGDGTFEDVVSLVVGQNPYSLRQGDMDGDGQVDLVTANWRQNTVTVLQSFVQNDGGTGFAVAGHFRVQGVEPRWAPVGDVNGDRSIDIVSADHDSDNITALLNQLPAPFTGPFIEHICTATDFREVARISTRRGAVDSVVKYTVPADPEDESLLSPKFQNSRLYDLHEDFLAENFPDHFPLLDTEEFDRLVGRRATREYFVGSIDRVLTPDDGIIYAFTIFTNTGADFAELLFLEEVRRVHDTLSEVFELPLWYQPDTQAAKDRAETWANPGFPIYIPDGTRDFDYEPYTIAVGYGRVRILDEDGFNERNGSGRFTLQDLLVLDFAPADIEGIVGGIITGDVQADLSHLAIRTARRGTPNAFVANAHDEFRDLEGQLVRLEVLARRYTVEPATTEEAEAFWEKSRPDIGELPAADLEYAGFDSLLEMDVSGANGPPASRYGGKASNFARLQRILTGEHEQYAERGFSIPMRYYREFVRSNLIPSLGDTDEMVTYEDYLLELLASPEFQSDSSLRFQLLEDFRDYMEDNGTVPQELIDTLARRVDEVFGFTLRRVRFRSSSNVEDLLQFNGAGLYESTSVCAADDLDDNSSGPSLCDPDRNNERGVARGLKRVWSSLWTFRAFEERSFFRIPQEGANMGLLVSRAFPDEIANGVAFTGNPNDPLDKRFVVTAQVGENPVVSPAPGEVPERNFIEVVDGEVIRIQRDRQSSLVEPGESVLSDETLEEMGRLMWYIDRNLPVDLEGHDRRLVVFDLEFKIEPDGSLAVKQVRPFLIPVDLPPTPSFELAIPAGTTVCAQLNTDSPDREPREMYESKSTLRFVEGPIDLTTDSRTFSAELLEEVRFGPEKEVLVPLGPGVFEVIRIPSADDGPTTYQFDFEQKFESIDLPAIGFPSYTVQLKGLQFQANGEKPVVRTFTLDEAYITDGLVMEGDIDDVPVARYSSCSYDLLPLWAVEAEIEGGASVSLRLRHRESEDLRGTGPASVVRSRVSLGGREQTVTDYWRLTYSSRNHNLRARYWTVLEPPVEVPVLERPVKVIELLAPAVIGERVFEAELKFLDENFQLLSEPPVLSFGFERTDDPLDPLFRRGDTDANGDLNLTDVIRVLNYLFLDGEAPSCMKTADANDDGGVNISDAVTILRRLFQGGRPLPEPAEVCGLDPTEDTITCDAFPVCP